MKIKYLIVVGLLFVSHTAWSWGYNTHFGLTRAASRYVFNPNRKTQIKLSVPVKWDMADVDFGKTIGMSMGGGLFESYIGMIIDNAALKDKYKVDMTLDYPYKGSRLAMKDSSSMDVIMAVAGTDPDSIDQDTGLLEQGECLFGHSYAANGVGFADVMTEYFYKLAVKTWKSDQKTALVYLCYASHYLADAGVPVHAEADYRNIKTIQWQMSFHNSSERWVGENWDTMKYQAVADSAAQVPMPVCDIASMVRSLAIETYPDLAEWSQAWGYKAGTSTPANIKKLDDMVRMEILRVVPRISGMFIKFKDEVAKL